MSCGGGSGGGSPRFKRLGVEPVASGSGSGLTGSARTGVPSAAAGEEAEGEEAAAGGLSWGAESWGPVSAGVELGELELVELELVEPALMLEGSESTMLFAASVGPLSVDAGGRRMSAPGTRIGGVP